MVWLNITLAILCLCCAKFEQKIGGSDGIIWMHIIIAFLNATSALALVLKTVD
jgi:hypothetical protein